MLFRFGLTVGLVCLGLVAEVEAKPADSFGSIEILRDRWGVPHVFSDTDEGAMYGLGYACAEDRAFQMVYSLRLMQGRLAETIGDVPQLNRGKGTTLDSDKKMRILGFYRAATKLVANLDTETVKLLEAYCDGVNDYVAEHPDDLLYLFKKLDLKIEPWTPADCIAS
ncbi:MAG: penicillin acylase family protein [bacterium]